MIIPPPGKGSCQNFGYQPDDYTEVAKYAAWEAGKYLGKALDQETTGEDDRGVVKRVKNLTRSKGWLSRAERNCTGRAEQNYTTERLNAAV